MASKLFQVIYFDGKKQVFLEDSIKDITWSGDIKQAARKLQISLKNVNEKTWNTPLYHFENGKELRFLYKGAELFRGVIFETSISTNGETTLVAYDELIYLTKNSDDFLKKNVKASSLISSLCKEIGVPVGKVQDTGYIIKKIAKTASFWELFQFSLTLTKKETGKRFWIYSREGKLYLEERKVSPVRWVIEEKKNLIEANKRVSIEELINSIKVRQGTNGEKGSLTVVEKDANSVAKYGVMQSVENVSDMKSGQMREHAKKLLKEKAKPTTDIDVTATGASSVISGKGIYAYDSMTGLSGGYYVLQDTHKWSASGSYTMDITLSATDELPLLEDLSQSEINDSKK